MRFGLPIIIVALGLTACAPQAAVWSGVESPNEIEVTWVQSRHQLIFEGGTEISAAEQARVESFLAQIWYSSSRLEIAAATDQLALMRADALQGYLEPVSPGTPLRRDVSLPVGVIALVAGHYVAAPPSCPDWRKPAGADYGNSKSSNFGCASATNLALMLADPGDLVRGRQFGPADGAAFVNGIRRYRTGQVTPLVSSVTTE